MTRLYSASVALLLLALSGCQDSDSDVPATPSACDTNPCLNNGICSEMAGGYACSCVEGTTGAHCETLTGPCDTNPCQHGGSCNETTDGYVCTCLEGTTGTHCETLVGACDTNPCQHDGTCMPNDGGYQCACPANWTGDHCDIDVDECAQATDTCDRQNGVCTNNDGGFSCACRAPAELGDDGHTCTVTCMLVCDPYARCLVIDGDARCQCDAGHLDLSANHDGTLCAGPPQAYVDGEPLGVEDHALVVQLRYHDDGGNSATLVVDALTQPEDTELHGRLFQFDDALADDTGDTATAVEITTFPAVVTDDEGRVIYLPAANANSEGVPESRRITPVLTFHAYEEGHLDGDDGHTSLPAEATLWFTAVNDPPSAMLTSDNPDLCVSACTFAEDFGHSVDVIDEPALVYGGGIDPDGDGSLTLTVLEVECPMGTVTNFSGEVIQMGTTITDLAMNTLTPVFYFHPLPDNFGSNYCVISYRLNDGALDSIDNHTITIHVTPLNDKPRFETPELVTYEETPLAFNIDAYDPDSVGFTVTLLSCSSAATSGELAVFGSGGDRHVVDCDNLANAPVVLATAANGGSWSFEYQPPVDAAGLGMMVLELLADDGVGPMNSESHFTPIHVLALNDAPMLALNDPPGPPNFTQSLEYSLSAPYGAILAFGLVAEDLDIGMNMLAYSVTANSGVLSFAAGFDRFDEMQAVTLENRHIAFQAPLALLNEALAAMRLTVTQHGSCSLTMTLSDQGFLGACPPDPEGTPGAPYCPQTATGTIVVSVP